jgi:ATP-dependent Clp protease adaptor protein ClpS
MNGLARYFGGAVFNLRLQGLAETACNSHIPCMIHLPANPVTHAPRGMAGHEGEDDGHDGPNVGIATRTRARTKRPSLYKVLMLNDDYTPMEFVVHVLQRFFKMDMEEATRVMLHVHQRGVGVCGIFSYEVAETKVNQVMDFARQNQHPLQCTLEKA